MLLECTQRGDVIVTEHRMPDGDVLVLSTGTLVELPEDILVLAQARGATFVPVVLASEPAPVPEQPKTALKKK